MPTVTEGIQNFLTARLKDHNDPELLKRWNPNMETQLNVSARNGTPVDGRRNTYTDGQFTWWNIRIPKKANSEPEWHDYELTWPLDPYVDGIGSTGWDFVDRLSRWCGYDFDSITGHAAGVGITDDQLAKVKQAAMALPFVEVRRSTGGQGIHLIVPGLAIHTANHTEHAALARCILSLMSTECSFDFASQVDACGGNLWMWHRKMSYENQGLALIKSAERPLTAGDLPPNWRDHVEVVTRKRAKIRITGIPESEIDAFESLTSGRTFIPLDDTHKAIIAKIGQHGYSCVWVPDHHLVQTHTHALVTLLEKERETLKLKGFFTTISQSQGDGVPNCFMFPLTGGAFRVYHFNKGAVETPTWRQDGSSYTWCDFNRLPDLATAASALGGVEAPEGRGYSFPNAEDAAKVIEALGQSIVMPDPIKHRPTILRTNKDGRLIVEVKREKKADPENIPGWDNTKAGWWRRLVNVQVEADEKEIDFDKFDKVIRSLITPAGDRAGWIHRSMNQDGKWVRCPKDDCRSILLAMGQGKPEAEQVLGLCAIKPWMIVNLPFQPEYPGGRKWNKDAVQYKYPPANQEYDDSAQHPHWDKILDHIGNDLSATIKTLDWCQKANILTGRDYLLHWIACLMREPLEQLPYLFLFGPQNSGKSIFHEAIKLLLVPEEKAVVKADRAVTSAEFNHELDGAILCYIEEKDISQIPQAYNRIKDLVTAKTLSIRKMRTDSYQVPNWTHWVHNANSQKNCPVFPGDTRITVIYVPELINEIPKTILTKRLEEEAPAFMRTILNLVLVPLGAGGRLRLPVVSTDRKKKSESLNTTALERFIEAEVHYAPGQRVLFQDFYAAFEKSLDPAEDTGWTRRRVSNELPERFPTGRGNHNKMYVGNASLQPVVDGEENAAPLISVNGRLKRKTEVEEQQQNEQSANT